MGTYSYSKHRLSYSYKMVSSLMNTSFYVIFLQSFERRISYVKLELSLGMVCLMRMRLLGSD